MSSSFEKNDFKCATWNARSVKNKKIQCETLIYQYHLHLLSVTKTWLTQTNNKYSIKGYNCVSCSRNSPTPGGGTAILIKNTFTFDRIDLNGPRSDLLQIVGISTNTVLGCLYFISMYVPPNSKFNIYLLIEFTNKIPTNGKIVLMEDFNAHLSTFLPFRVNKIGGAIIQLLKILNLIVLNAVLPTIGSNTDYLDNIFGSSPSICRTICSIPAGRMD